MECSIYNPSLTRIGFLSNFTSLVWGESYSGAGDFQLVTAKTAHSIPLLTVGNLVGIPTSDTLMLIQSTEDKDGELWAYGCEAKCLLASRVYAGTINVVGKIETALRNAVTASRPYDFLGLAPLRGLSARIKSQRTYPTIFDLSKIWCDTAGYGFRLIHDKAAHKLLYDVYAGVDRTNIKFAENYGNLSNLTRLISETSYKTIAYVGGGGEGADRVFVTAGDDTLTGLARREMYVDARDLQQEEGQTVEEYRELLVNRGLEALEENSRNVEISFDISSQDFGKTFFLGDRITCVLPEYGAAVNVRIAEYKKIYENNTERVELTLGNPVARRL